MFTFIIKSSRRFSPYSAAVTATMQALASAAQKVAKTQASDSVCNNR
jgi:hypothetical protein